MAKTPVTPSKLKKLGASWKAAAKRDPSSGFEDLEAGIYLMAITGAVVDEFGDKKKLAVKWQYTVQEGEAAGQAQTDFDNLETEDNLFWLQSKLAKLGYELPEDVNELPEILADIEASKPIVRCRVVCKDDFTHVYINKLVEADGGMTKEELNGDAPKKPSSVKKTAKPEPEDQEEEAAPVSRKKTNAEDDTGFEVGDKVTFEEEGETFTGKIEKIANESADVLVEESDEVWDVNLSELTKVEDEEEASAPKKKTLKKKAAEPEIEVGSKVSFTDGDDKYEGKVTVINDDTADVKVGKDVYEVALSDLTLA